jgi:hypothetical protein
VALDSSCVLRRTATSRTTRGGAADARRDPTPLDSNRLGFLPLAEWDEYNSYEEATPSRLRYSIEWKVAVNNRVVTKDTEQDIVLVPAAYWHMYLKPKVEKLLSKKVAHNRHVEYDDTGVVVSVNDRSERDLIKRFDNIDIDWSVVEKQLVRWGELFRAGKRLRVDLSFNYVDASSQPASTANRGNKRGSSATQRMLADRTSHMEDEQETSGSPSIWQEVYALMRCPGPPCNLGPHCWRDPFGKRHYKLRTHHLKALVGLAQQGHTLKSHDDVPEDIREQLYAEEHQRREQQTAATLSLDAQKETAQTVIDAYNAWDIDAILAYQTPDCQHQVLPSSMACAAQTNSEYRRYLSMIMPMFLNFTVAPPLLIAPCRVTKVGTGYSSQGNT